MPSVPIKLNLRVTSYAGFTCYSIPRVKPVGVAKNAMDAQVKARA